MEMGKAKSSAYLLSGNHNIPGCPSDALGKVNTQVCKKKNKKIPPALAETLNISRLNV